MKRNFLKSLILPALFLSLGSNLYAQNIDSPEYKKQQAILEEANVLFEAGKMTEGMAKLKDALNACPTCPDSPEIKQLLGAEAPMNQIEESKYQCAEPAVDNGISGPTHTAYNNKIVFSKTEIVKAKENTALFANSFTSADNIYSRVYIDKSADTEAKSMGLCYGGYTSYRYTIDGGKFKFKDASSTASVNNEPKWTTWQLALSPSVADGYPKTELQAFYDKLYELPEGTHKIKVELVFDIPEDKIGDSDLGSYMYTTKFGAEKILASGEFTLTVKNADKPIVKKKLGAKSKEELQKEAEEAYRQSMKNASSSSSSSSTSSSGAKIINKTNESPSYYTRRGTTQVGSGSVYPNSSSNCSDCDAIEIQSGKFKGRVYSKNSNGEIIIQ